MTFIAIVHAQQLVTHKYRIIIDTDFVPIICTAKSIDVSELHISGRQ